MTSLHVELREHRERQGLTLEAIQAATRINPDFLKAMEQGDFGFLPRPYVRLFLRTYATQVGMDPQDALDRYEELSRPAQQEEVPPVIERQRPFLWVTAGALAAGLILLGYGGVRLFKGEEDTPPAALRVGQPSPFASAQEKRGRGGTKSVHVSTTNPVPKAVATATALPTLPTAVAEGPAGQRDTTSARSMPLGIAWTEKDSIMVLRGACIEQTWLDIRADGQRVFHGTINPGEERTWTARKGFYVVAGRSSGVAFSLQGQPLPPVKAWASEVLRWSINRDKITQDRRPHLTAGSGDTLSPRPADSIGRE